MITEISQYTHHFSVRGSESDIHNSASLYSMSNYLQEAARVHAEKLKLGMDLLREKQRFWVLTSMIINVDYYPMQGTKIEVRTWPKGMDKIFALRDFEIWQGDHKIGRATSSWVLLDLKTRRPAPVNDLGEFMFERANMHAIEHRAKKLASPDQPEYRTKHRVTYSELDLNGHVNNTRYVAWMMDTFPTAYHRALCASHVQTNYLAEVFPDQEIDILRKEIQPHHYLFEVQNQQGKALFRAQLFFKPIKSNIKNGK